MEAYGGLAFGRSRRRHRVPDSRARVGAVCLTTNGASGLRRAASSYRPTRTVCGGEYIAELLNRNDAALGAFDALGGKDIHPRNRRSMREASSASCLNQQRPSGTQLHNSPE